MDKIQIIDNFLDHTELNVVKNILNNYDWKYGHTSGDKETFMSKFFANYEQEDIFMEYIKKKIEKVANQSFKINRFYKHIQTFGQNGGYHIDDTGSNKYTFCIYITDLNDDEIENSAGGDFLIKIPPNNKAIMSIATKNNRGVLFPSTYYHKGMAYTNNFNQKRTCITWKLEIYSN